MAERDGGRLLFEAGLDNSNLRAGAAQATGILHGIGDRAVAEGARIDNTFKKIATGIGSVFVLQQASQFISQIARVRGEFQQLEVAFETMLQSKQKSDALMAQLVRTAAVTPFGMKDVAGGAKQLLAYGEAADTVNDTLIRLGNIASGLSIPLNDLVYLYGTTMVQGRLFTQDVRQFQGRGIPLLQELGKALGKSTDEINAMVTAGKVGFPEVQKVINNLTNEGGTFYNLMEKQSKTITGQISNLGDAFDTMLNKIGQSNEGVISSAISGATLLVENYEKIGKEILGLVAAYGAYKAALITLNAVRMLNIKILRQAVLEKALAAKAGIALSNAQAIAAARTKLLAVAQQGLVKSLKAVSAAMLSNPYVLVAAAVAGLSYGIYKLATAETAAEAAQRKHNEAMEAAKEKKEGLISRAQQLANKINDETQTIYAQIKAWKELQKEMPEAFANMDIREFKAMKPEGRDKLINKTADEQNIANGNAELERREKLLANINETISKGAYHYGKYEKEAEKLLGLDGFWKSRSNDILDVRSGLEESIRLLKEEKKLRDEIIRQAEFESKTDSEKLNILNAQLQEYRKQYAEIEKLVPASERVADSANKAFTPLISNVGKELSGVNTEWAKFDFQTQVNIAKLNALNGKMGETSNMISGINAARQGITYAEAKSNARKAYEDAKKLVEDIAKNSKSYTQKAYMDAVDDLDAKKKAYNALGGDTTKQKAASKPRDYTEQIAKEKQEAARLYKDLEFAVEQARIDAMDKGAKKILDQNKLNYEKEVEQIARQKEDLLKQIQEHEKTIWESQNPDREKKGTKFTPATTKLSEAEENKFNAIQKDAEVKFGIDNEEAYKEALKSYADFAKSYLDKVEEFKDNIKNLESKGAGAETIADVKSMQAAILAGLDEEMNVKEATFITFVESLVGMGLEQLLEALNTAKEALQTELSSGGGDKEKITQLRAKVQSLTSRINEMAAVKDETKSVKTEDPTLKWTKMLGAMRDVKEATDEVIDSFDGMNDATKALLNSTMTISTSAINMLIGIQTLGVGAATTTATTATTAAAAISTVEKASVILAIISAAIQIIMAIVNVAKQFFNDDKKKEKEIQNLQGKVDALSDAYEKLGRAIDKAYSTNAKNLITQQDANLRKQKAVIEEQIRLEEDKKDTDGGKVQQYKDAIKEIDGELEKTQDKIVEAIIGVDISAAIDDFAEAYVDAWAAGEDKAASMHEAVRKMIKSSVAELIKSRLSPEVTAFMSYLATAMEDGILSIAEQNTLDALENSIYNKLNGLDASLGKYVEDKQNEAREASSKGFASMSQDSANELNGRFTAIQELTSSIAESTKTLVVNSGRALQHLAGIESNTEACRRLNGMDADLTAIKNSINDIALKGIAVKS